MTKALVVFSQPPTTEGGAPGKCAVALLRGLKAHGIDVRAIAARQHFSVGGDPPPDLPVEVIDVPPEPPSWAARVRRWRRPRGELSRGEFAERVREAARDADVLHLEETEVAWSDEGVATPSLVHVQYLARRDRPLGPPWRRQFRQVLEFSAAERLAARRHRWLVASSPLVADELRRLAPHAEVVVAPLALDPADYEPAALDGPPVVGFVGTAAWPPTAGALLRLVTRVWPLVLREVPDATLRIAGRGTDALRALADVAGVELAGPVPSAQGFLRGTSMLLFPLTRGSGVKVKTLEALATGVPTVTTAAGAEGLDAPGGILVAEHDASLAAAAVELLRDAEARRESGRLARAAFEERYSPVPATAPLVELYERMAHGRVSLRPAAARAEPRTPRRVGARPRLGGRVLVVSPHPDDAAFSLGATLARAARDGADVTVATVFAGDPGSTAAAGDWDRRAGFATVGEAARARREEDRRACELLGVNPVWLSHLDDQYPRTSTDDELWEDLAPLAAAADAILVPAFPLAQQDHARVARLFSRRAPDRRVGLYVEQPYAVFWAERAQRQFGAHVLTRAPDAEWTPARASRRDALVKLRACRSYRSQLPLLGTTVLGRVALFEQRRGGELIAWPR